jgi:hypothetical protein
MVVWQFATIAALIGALLTYVMVLTNRLGTTNVLLKRIEEGLVRPQPVAESAPVPTRHVPAATEPARAGVLEAVRTMEVASVPADVSSTAEVPESEASAFEIADRDRRVSYLTVRDLKLISRSDQAPAEVPAAAVAESDAVDAAALEEKRRRDLLMHAQRRRRRLR